MAPKSKSRKQAFRLWRAGHVGLTKLQTIVDKLIEEKGSDVEMLALGLADLKLKINKEVRDNAAFELKERREALELSDIEAAHRNGTSLMLQVKSQIEAQLKRLVDLGELVEAISGGKGAPSPAITDPDGDHPTTDKPHDDLSEALAEGESVHEADPDLTMGPSSADASESIPEDVVSSGLEGSGPDEDNTESTETVH